MFLRPALQRFRVSKCSCSVLNYRYNIFNYDLSKNDGCPKSSTTSSYSTAAPEWSYSVGPGHHALLGVTIGTLLQNAAATVPDREAYVFSHQNQRRSFAELLQDSDDLAAGLMSFGVQKGDRVGIWAPNGIEWILAKYAAARGGFILVNINPAYQVPELEHALNKVEVKALIMSERFKTQDYYGMLTQLAPELPNDGPGKLKSKRLPHLQTIVMAGENNLPGTITFHELLKTGTGHHHQIIQDLQHKIQFDDPICIQFTSGTTGNPKAATLSHHNLVNNAYNVGLRTGYDEKHHTICLPVPLYHCFGMVLGSLQTMVHHVTCVLPCGSFEAAPTMKAVMDEKCTALYGTPTMFIDMLHLSNFKEYNTTSLSTGIMAGSPCPIEVIRQVMDDLHMPDISIAYGSTESSPVVTQTLRSDPIEMRVKTVGKASAHTEIKIVNEDHELQPLGSVGELCSRGYSTMIGYWNDPEKTEQAIDQTNWYHTGDVGFMDENGYLHLTGRMKDMVIRGGENIYPTEVENFLHKHPDVADVQVIGVPDERLGEEVCAWIRLKNGAQLTPQDVKAFCKGKLSHFKVPRFILFVDDFPLTVTGKVQKFRMRELSPDMIKKQGQN